MAHKKGGKAPIFDGTNYAYQKARMESFQVSLRFGVQKSIAKGFTLPDNGVECDDETKDYENNAKGRNAIQSVLSNFENGKVISLKSSKYIKINFQHIYDGEIRSNKKRCKTTKKNLESY